jgi:heat-inducible transcriptional repressor
VRDGEAAGAALRQRLAGLSAADAHAVLAQLVTTHTATVLGYATPESIQATSAFRELGFDSMTAVDLRNRLNRVLVGQRLTEVSDIMAGLPDQFSTEDRLLVRAVVEALEDSLDVEREERIVLAGTANLARSGPDFVQSIGPVLEAIEEHVVLLKLLTEMADGAGGVGVLIGSETAHVGLQEASVVSSGYASHGEVVARLGVLGPTRMDYPTTMAAVRAVARYVSRILAS